MDKRGGVPMPSRKKTVKKSVRHTKSVKPKSVKFSRKPASKVVKKASKSVPAKKGIKKVVKSKKPAAKTVSQSTKKTTFVKVISKVTEPMKRLLTAEGWRRMMLKKQKA